jgi:small-conductance mechanosensitive channel
VMPISISSLMYGSISSIWCYDFSMKLLRYFLWIVTIFFILSALFFSVFTEMSGEGKRWLIGMAVTCVYGLSIHEKR